MAPASFKASISVSSCPFRLQEIEAAWKIRIFSLEARERLSLRTGTESTVGEVFAMQITEVKPPFARQVQPVWMVSFISKSRITEMNVGVNQSRCNHKPGCVKDFLSFFCNQGCHFFDDAIFNQKIHFFGKSGSRIDDKSVFVIIVVKPPCRILVCF